MLQLVKVLNIYSLIYVHNVDPSRPCGWTPGVVPFRIHAEKSTLHVEGG